VSRPLAEAGKRWLYLVHRWIGVAACVLMALWFLSGLVMLYVGYPRLTAAERLAALPPLAVPETAASPGEILRRLQLTRWPDEARLAMVAGEAAWLLREGRDRWSVAAADGSRVHLHSDRHRAARSAQEFRPGVAVRFVEEVHEDSWTHAKSLDPHRPLFRFAFDDPSGIEVYVSSRTGEVVLESSSVERTWYWAGAWLHWMYMFRGNRFDPAWHDIVVWTSLLATVGSVAGLWVGILRWRFRSAYKGTASHSPYREPWMWWHHVLGLVFALATIFWIFSGLMSMNPWKMFTTPGAKPADLAAYRGGVPEAARFELAPPAAFAALRDAMGEVKELELAWFDARPWYVGRDGRGVTRLIEARAGAQPMAGFDPEAVARAAARLLPGEGVRRVTKVEAYDNWYLQRVPHPVTGRDEKPLPVLRIEFADAHATLFHVDPRTSVVLERIDERRRWRRWLYSAMHSWDLRGLVDRRPLWDVLMIGFSLGGFALCITSIVIAWRRVKRKVGVPVPRVARAA